MKFVLLTLFAITATVMSMEAPDKGDFRNEFDHMLVMTVTELMQKGEAQLLMLQHQIDELNKNKSKELQTKIVQEIEVSVAMIEGSMKTIERELQRKDLNVLEKFNFEELLAMGKLVVKDLKEVEVKVKAVDTQ